MKPVTTVIMKWVHTQCNVRYQEIHSWILIMIISERSFICNQEHKLCGCLLKGTGDHMQVQFGQHILTDIVITSSTYL